MDGVSFGRNCPYFCKKMESTLARSACWDGGHGTFSGLRVDLQSLECIFVVKHIF